MGRGLGNRVDLGVAVGVDVIVGLGVGDGVTVGVRVGVALGVGVGLGKHVLSHVNKTSDYLLAPLAGGFYTGDEEATFILVGDYRAASWKLDWAGKNVHCFTEQESIRRQ